MKTSKKLRGLLALTIVFGATLAIYGCGGGSGNGATSGVNGSITGSAVKGPVNGATVAAFAIENGVMGAQLGSGTTDGQGNFTISIGSYAGPLMLQMSGGAYVDEATGVTMNVNAGDHMTSLMPSFVGGATMSGVQITPLTSMAQAMAQNMAGGMTEANIAAANAAMGNFFSVDDILYTHPMNPLAAGSGSLATQDMRNYGMLLAAISQSANALGMPSSAGMVTAMSLDAADGVMNGMENSTKIGMNGMGGMMGSGTMPAATGTGDLAAAMTSFMNSAMNQSGLTAADMQTLMNKLTASGGQIQ